MDCSNSIVHVIGNSQFQFLPKEALNSFIFQEVVRKLMYNCLPDVLVVNFKICCACSNPGSLQCLSRSVLIKQVVSNLRAVHPSDFMWVNCCSRIVGIKVEPLSLYVLNCWRHCWHYVEHILENTAVSYRAFVLERKVIFFFSCAKEDLLRLTQKIHEQINMKDCVGYHIMPVHPRWKNAETATLNSGHPCMLLYVRVNGVEIQERALKRMYKNKLKRCFE